MNPEEIEAARQAEAARVQAEVDAAVSDAANVERVFTELSAPGQPEAGLPFQADPYSHGNITQTEDHNSVPTLVDGSRPALFRDTKSPLDSTSKIANQNAITQRGIDQKVADERAAANKPQDTYARSGLLDPTQTTGKGGGGNAPTVATMEHYASTQAVADGLDGLANEYEKVYGEATADILASRGMMLEAVDAYKASNADLDPKALYEEVSKRMQENDQKVEQVRQYFVNLSGQSVNPARLYANGGAMTASLAVAVGALSQAMLGPGAPNTALNILESALERDIRAQEMTLNNARQAGQGMLQALAASQEILGDRVQAMSTTKIALREDLLARLEGAVKLTGNAVSRANLAQVYAESQQKALIEKSKLDGQIIRSVTSLSAAQVRKGALTQQVQTMAQRLVDANAPQAPQAAAPAQPAAPSSGISSSDVAGKRVGGKATKKKVTQPPSAPAGLSYQSGWAPGEAPDQDADGVPNSVDPDFDPDKPEMAPKAAAPAPATKGSHKPVEGDTIKDQSGNIVRVVVKSSTGQLVAGESPPGLEGLGAVYDTARFKKINTMYNSKDVNDVKFAESILVLPGIYHNQKNQDAKAVAGIRQWIKDNPGTRGVALTVRVDGVYTDPEAQKLQEYISSLSGPALQRYRKAAQMSDAISEKERPLALGDLASGSNQFIDVDGLRMIADNAEEDSATSLADIKSRLHQNGMAVIEKRTTKEVNDHVGAGGLKGAKR